MRRIWLLGAILACTACGDPVPKVANSGTPCSADPPGCGVCSAAVCTDGSWSCEGTPCAQNISNQCESDPPGCGPCEAPVCDGAAWTCQGTPCAQNFSNTCQSEPPGCPCDALCVDGSWSCDCSVCEPSSTTTLDGVEIAFGADRCSWTLSEAAAGIEIPYTITIAQAQTVLPTGQASCATPGPSGLAPFELIEGSGQRYCICDAGLCQQLSEPVDLIAGTYEFTLAWDGVNWEGPSDTGNPKGAPFPAGEYTATVSAIGMVGEAGYEVRAELPIVLIAD